MTKSQAEQILRFCQLNHLPKPQRYPLTGKTGHYIVKFNSNRMRGQYSSFAGAMTYCISMLNEKKDGGFGV